MRTINIFIVSLLIGSCIIALEMEMEMAEEFYPDERDALIQLRDMVESPSSKLHANWTGRACDSKNESRWAGVGCSDWHVTHLVLEGIQLTNSVPFPPLLFHNLTYLTKLSFANNSLHGPLPNLTNLVQLQYVVLSNNHYSGSIPFTYIDLPHLTKLELQENDLSGQIPPFDQQPLMAFNVSHNQLGGPIPETRVLQRFPESSYANNSGLCGGNIPGVSPCPPPPPVPFQPSTRKDGSLSLQPWSIAVIAAVVVTLGVILTCYMRVWRKAKRRKQEVTDDPEGTSMEMEMEFWGERIFSVDELLRSAAEVMGRGNLGSTYKAVLECGSVVAVKRITLVEEDEHQVKKKKMKMKMKKEEFGQQMQVLGNMQKHENLAEMISFYNSKEEKLIVYEYVADGSLFSLLHESKGMVVLDWKSRVGMIMEIAKGVEHLHRHDVAHGNLKSSNVLIQRVDPQSGSMRVKLTDYGLLGVAPPHKLSVGRTPEYVEKKKVSKAADVYCLGIVVLELVTGRAPTPRWEELSGWVREAVSIDWSTDIVDTEMLGEGYEEDMLRLTEMALQCTEHLPHHRPDITQILTTLQHMMHHYSIIHTPLPLPLPLPATPT